MRLAHMRLSPRTLLALAAAVSPISCASTKPTVAQGAAQASVDGCPASAASVSLRDPGAQPRRRVRYRYALGRTQDIRFEMHGSAELEVEGQARQPKAIPGAELAARLAITRVEPDGRAAIEIDVTRGAWGAGPSDAIRGIEDASASLVLDPCGAVRAFDKTLPEGAGDQVAPRLQHLKETLRRLRPVLPSQPIGVGARWTVTGQVETNGIKSEETLDYELRGEGDGALSIVVTQREVTPAQTLEQTDPLDVLGGGSTGRGALTIALDAPAPKHATLSTDIAVKMRANVRGQAVGITANTNVAVSIEGP